MSARAARIDRLRRSGGSRLSFLIIWSILMTRAISAAGLELVERNEGLRLSAYRDVAGIWTIGYGHTPAHPGQSITEEQAIDLLRRDIGHAEAAVEACTRDVPTTDEQFSAMVSLTFNIGAGAFGRSTVLKRHLAGDYKGAGDAFLMWSKSHVNGQLVMVPGLLRRRNEERKLYQGDVKPRPQPAPAPAAEPTSASPSAWGRVARLFGA
jgi:lysozyme